MVTSTAKKMVIIAVPIVLAINKNLKTRVKVNNVLIM